MGLHVSEYWTYTLPRRVGAQHTARLIFPNPPIRLTMVMDEPEDIELSVPSGPGW